MADVSYQFGGLKQLIRGAEELQRKHIQVGIFSDRADRHGDVEPIDNPSLGLVHEKGSISHNIPARSFLDMPLTLFFPKHLEAMGAPQIVEMLIEEGADTVAEIIGAEAEATVQEAFETGGFGFWPQWSTRYARRNEIKTRRKTKRLKFIGPIKPGSLLIQSAQLRNSIESRVVE